MVESWSLTAVRAFVGPGTHCGIQEEARPGWNGWNGSGNFLSNRFHPSKAEMTNQYLTVWSHCVTICSPNTICWKTGTGKLILHVRSQAYSASPPLWRCILRDLFLRILALWNPWKYCVQSLYYFAKIQLLIKWTITCVSLNRGVEHELSLLLGPVQNQNLPFRGTFYAQYSRFNASIPQA